MKIRQSWIWLDGAATYRFKWFFDSREAARFLVRRSPLAYLPEWDDDLEVDWSSVPTFAARPGRLDSAERWLDDYEVRTTGSNSGLYRYSLWRSAHGETALVLAMDD